ncbi:MAG: alpha/beta hydrolase [Anaerolineae bacterium]|nr:alpha/beta hydrolase [Anaerolineae bacterium]
MENRSARYVNIHNERIFYSKWDGDPCDGHPPLVLVHGAGGTHLHWPPQLRRLRDANVYALDLPGHGHSLGQGRDSIAAYGAVILAWAEALALPPFVLAGHSMGGAIALDFALNHAERLAGLVLVASGARLRVHPDILQGVQDDFPATAKLLCDWAHGERASEHSRRQYLRRLLEVNPGVLRGDFLACDAFDVRPRLGEIAVPTLVIGGSEDRLTPPRFSEYLREHIPNAQLLLVEGAGHMVMLERPQAVTEAIADFLQQAGSGSQVSKFQVEDLKPGTLRAEPFTASSFLRAWFRAGPQGEA